MAAEAAEVVTAAEVAAEGVAVEAGLIIRTALLWVEVVVGRCSTSSATANCAFCLLHSCRLLDFICSAAFISPPT